MIRTIKTVSLALIFALGIMMGFIGGLAISLKDCKYKNGNSCVIKGVKISNKPSTTNTNLQP